MPTPDQQRMDAISDALARLVHQQDEFAHRMGRIEDALRLSPMQSSTAPPPMPMAPLVTREPATDAQAENWRAAYDGPPPTPPGPPISAPPLPAVPELPPKQGLESNIGLTLMNRVGAFTLILGIAFLFKWAVDNNWIGPGGRVMLGLLAGFLTIGGADLFWRRGQKVFAHGMTAAGASILYIAIYSAFGFYHLIDQGIAFAGLLAITALTAALALRYDSIAIAALALMSGYLTLMVLSSGEDHPVFLFAYILLLDASAMVLARLRSWRLLEVLSFVPTVLLFLAWFFTHFKSEKHLIAIAFLIGFYALYANSSIHILLFLAQLFTALAFSAVEDKSSGIYFPLEIALAVAGLAVADRRRWRTAVSVAFGSFWWASIWWTTGLFHALRLAGERPEAFFGYFTIGYLLFLAWTPWWVLVRKEIARTQDMAVLALNPVAYFGISYWLLNPNHHAWMGLFAVALAGVQLGLGYELWRRQDPAQRNLPPVLLTIGVAFGFLTLAAPLQFSAWRITMAWALEGAALSWIGSRFKERRMLAASMALFVLALFRLVSVDAWIYPPTVPYSIFFNDRFFTFGLSAVCLWLAALWMEDSKELRLAAYIGGHFVMLWALTQEVLGWVDRSAERDNLVSVETISVSILYAVYAFIFIGIGVATRSKVNRIAGLGLIGVVVLKLYLFDVWQLSRVHRTIAFVVLGILLMSTSFLYSRFRGMIDTWWKDDAPHS